jgi:hypothetical protein
MREDKEDKTMNVILSIWATTRTMQIPYHRIYYNIKKKKKHEFKPISPPV